MKRVFAVCLLLFSFLFGLAGCAEPASPADSPPTPGSSGTGGSSGSSGSSDLMEGIEPSAAAGATEEELRSGAAKEADFAVRLFRRCFDAEKNTLVSPLSVLSALAMTANGAKGETLAEMEKTLGMSTNELNAYFKSMLERIRAEEGDTFRFHLANSVWFTSDERFTVNRDFLQTNADYYGADVYRAPFDDTTLAAINGWVNENTDGMIPSILDRIPADALMYLVNALAFEAEWPEPYDEYQVYPGDFTLEDGTKRKVDFMHSEESRYLEDGDAAVGFVKNYKGGKYAFAALLPKAGRSLSDYVASLDGEKLIDILSSSEICTVNAALPKFEVEFSDDLAEALGDMGMSAAFGPQADFSGLGTSTGGNISITRVLHKTFISVAEQGTRAGAATGVEMNDGCAPEFEEPKYVTLDRPFVYMLIDRETNVPFFIGTLTDPEK